MAGSAENRPARRLSVRAATEPLPTPLPPPPRPGRSVFAPVLEPDARDVHSVPPPPHFVTRFPAVDHSQFETKAAPQVERPRASEPQSGRHEPPVPARSLASPGVVLSLAASVAVMCAIGWYEKHGIEGLQLDTIKSFVQRWSIDRAEPDDDLPYITAVPLTPNASGIESIAKDAAPSTKKADHVVLSDLLKGEAPATSDGDRTQRR